MDGLRGGLVDVAVAKVDFGLVGNNRGRGSLSRSGEAHHHILGILSGERDGGRGLSGNQGRPRHGDVDTLSGLCCGDGGLVDAECVAWVIERGGDLALQAEALHVQFLGVRLGGKALEGEAGGHGLDGGLAGGAEDVLDTGEGIDFTVAEVRGIGAGGGECECQNGTHLWEDLYYPEIIDPVTLQPVEPGQKGELVFTTLDKWGMPMIRYRTRDLTHLIYDKCECGRTAVRMGKILGRSDDMMIIRGVNVFPSQIESILLEFPEYEPYFLIEVDRVNNTDTFDIQVEVKPEFYTDQVNELVRLRQRLTSRIQSVVGIQPAIKIVQPGTIERSTGKAKRAIDHRKFE